MTEAEKVQSLLNARALDVEAPVDMGDKSPVVEAMALTNDGWYSQLTGLSIYGQDKRENTKTTFTRKTYEFLTSVYQSSWLAARIIDKPIDEMMREGYDVVVGEDQEVAHDMEEALTDIKSDQKFHEALKWQSLYGGACILVGVNDGHANLADPVDEEAITSIDYLNVFDASEARVIAWQENPAAPDFGAPLYFRIVPTIIGNEVPVDIAAQPKATPASANMSQGIVNNVFIPAMQQIHASRILYFPGERISRRANLWQSTPGAQPRWGDSVLLRCIELIRDFEGAWNGTAYNLQEFEQAIFKIQGLAAALASDKQGFVQKRWQSIQLSRSMIKAVMLDKDGEDYERKASSMSGVADTLREFAVILAAAADMPVSVMLGSQDGGLGASGSGQNDIQNWYAAVKTKQIRRELQPLKQLVRYLFLAKEGPTKGQEPDHWRIDFKPLTQLSEKDKGELYYKIAQADQIYFNMGTLSNTDIAKARFSGRPLSVSLTVNMDELEAREDQATELQDQTHEATIQNLKEGGSAEPMPPAPVVAAKPKKK